MTKSTHSITTVTPWDTWDSTRYTHGDFHFMCTADGYGAYRSTHIIEAKYPGFLSVFQILTAVGCDHFFVTNVLKFCIVNAGDVPLIDFVESSNMVQSVRTALAIGLSGEELVRAMSNNEPVFASVVLPDDMSTP